MRSHMILLSVFCCSLLVLSGRAEGGIAATVVSLDTGQLDRLNREFADGGCAQRPGGWLGCDQNLPRHHPVPSRLRIWCSERDYGCTLGQSCVKLPMAGEAAGCNSFCSLIRFSVSWLLGETPENIHDSVFP